MLLPDTKSKGAQLKANTKKIIRPEKKSYGGVFFMAKNMTEY